MTRREESQSTNEGLGESGGVSREGEEVEKTLPKHSLEG